jgi:hypothetical protein
MRPSALTIPAGASVSNAVNIAPGMVGRGFVIAKEWKVSTILRLEVSDDNTNWVTPRDIAGTEISFDPKKLDLVKAVYITLTNPFIPGMNWVRVASGPSATPVNQDNAALVGLVWAKV